jgi:hypothetical protein
MAKVIWFVERKDMGQWEPLGFRETRELGVRCLPYCEDAWPDKHFRLRQWVRAVPTRKAGVR